MFKKLVKTAPPKVDVNEKSKLYQKNYKCLLLTVIISVTDNNIKCLLLPTKISVIDDKNVCY